MPRYRYDDPKDEPAEKPIVLSPEDLTEKLLKLEQRHNGLKISAVISWIMVIILGILSAVALTHMAPKAVPIAHPNAVDSLQTDVVGLHNDLGYLKAHTDTTGVGDMRKEVRGLRSMVEQRASDMDNLRKDINHYIINGPGK